MNARRYLPALLLVPLLLATLAAAPQITIVNRLYVAPGGLSSGSCDTWAHACNLQFALSYASGDIGNDELWVKQGTYKPGTLPTDTFALQDGVSILGGFAGTETSTSQRNWITHVTILSGDIGTVGVITDNSYHVVTTGGTDNTAVLNGFTITSGNASGSSTNAYGGGIYNASGSPTLSNLIIKLNKASYGAGMYDSSSSPNLTDVTFSGNVATYFAAYGGGMYDTASSPKLRRVIFSKNSAYLGGGMYEAVSSAALTGVSFNANSATNSGGGMDIVGGSPILNRVTFGTNKASYGAGVHISTGASGLFVNVTFAGNSASYGGGMDIASVGPTLINATFGGNKATADGGAIYDYYSTPEIYDSIFWNDTNSEVSGMNAGPTIKDSILAGGCPVDALCTHVVNSDPKLGALASNGGFSQTMALQAGSAAIDAGGVHVTCAASDERGVLRPQGGHCDMGAYEVRALAFKSGGTSDGWVLESGETTSVGGSMNSASATLRVGDDASNKQYRSVLSFNTSGIPDAATVVLARVKVKQASITGTNPFTTHGILTLDLKKPFFGAVLGLELGDFQAAPTVSPAGGVGSTLVSGWYLGRLNLASLGSVNKIGPTQLRLRFTTDDNNDNSADYLSLYSGNAATTSDRPLLIVYYNP